MVGKIVEVAAAGHLHWKYKDQNLQIDWDY